MKIRKYEDGGRDEFMMKVTIDCCVLIICLYITANASIFQLFLFVYHLTNISIISAPCP